MKSIVIIATNTFREIIRDRILYGIVVFALLLIGVSVALGSLSFAEQARISANFGFTGIQISASILAIFIGSTLVAREIEKQTILTLLARPVTRSQFLVGKFFGLVLVIVTVMAGLAVVVAALVTTLGLSIGLPFFVALYGIVLEALLLIAVTLLFGSFSRPAMTVIFATSIFLIGHWIGSLDAISKTKLVSDSFKSVSRILVNVVPDFERFNWRSAPIYDTPVPAIEILNSSLYAVGWLVFLLALTSMVFRRRDFV
ncbi:MAG: ABC transporter permease subunit [Bdellovibrionota bacterium]